MTALALRPAAATPRFDTRELLIRQTHSDGHVRLVGGTYSVPPNGKRSIGPHQLEAPQTREGGGLLLSSEAPHLRRHVGACGSRDFPGGLDCLGRERPHGPSIGGASSLAEEASNHEREVSWLLGESPTEVAVPVMAEWHVYAHSVALLQ